jgi:hypothetical protein
MPDSLKPGKVTSSVNDGVLTLQRRTYRSGDFVHVIFSGFSIVFAVLFFVIAIASNTLLDGFSIPIVILALGAYGYFGATRLVNRRVVTVTTGRITAKDRPLPQFMRSVDADIADVGLISVESSKRWTFPMIASYPVYEVATGSGPDLFRRLRDVNEAEYVVARIEAFAGPISG